METKETEGLRANDADEINSGSGGGYATSRPRGGAELWYAPPVLRTGGEGRIVVEEASLLRLIDSGTNSAVATFTKPAKAVVPKMIEEQET